MSRGGAFKEQEEPERKCLVTGASGGKGGLIRFVVSLDGEVIPDLAEKLAGRGAWVSADRSVLEKAILKGAFARSFRQPVRATMALIDLVEKLQIRRTLDALSFCRKAGLASCGFEKTKFSVLGGRLVALIEARDGSEDGMRKLRALAGDTVARINRLDAAELGLAFGRGSVVHAALERGGASMRAIREARRLAGFRAPPGGARNPVVAVEDIGLEG